MRLINKHFVSIHHSQCSSRKSRLCQLLVRRSYFRAFEDKTAQFCYIRNVFEANYMTLVEGWSAKKSSHTTGRHTLCSTNADSSHMLAANHTTILETHQTICKTNAQANQSWSVFANRSSECFYLFKLIHSGDSSFGFSQSVMLHYMCVWHWQCIAAEEYAPKQSPFKME